MIADARRPALDWLRGNEQHLEAEFERLANLVRAAVGGPLVDSSSRADESLERPVLPVARPASERLAEAFCLTPFERDVLLLAAAVELHSPSAAACASWDPYGRPKSTFGLAFAVLPEARWSAAAPWAPLRRWRLLELDGSGSLTSAPLTVDDRVLFYLSGLDALDARLEPIVRERAEAGVLGVGQSVIADTIASALRVRPTASPVVALWGNDAEGQADVAALAASKAGSDLFEIDAADIPTSAAERWQLGTLWAREVVLADRALLIRNVTPDTTADVAQFATGVGGTLFVASAHPFQLEREVLAVRVDMPSAAERRGLWLAALPPLAKSPADIERIAGLGFSAREIGRTARVLLAAAPSNREAELADSLVQRTRAASWRTYRLDAMASRIVPVATWEELVLPAEVTDTLREIVAQVRHRSTVYGDWGFAELGERGLGITALFAGESGTGKTMAAEVLANDLGQDLYRVDLSAVMSKYIGETEKNLNRVFDDAEDAGAILLFDEADALFGKRTEVRDSHDRYANLELSYLLQRMEGYAGLAILTSNMRSALDRAFQRRLRFIVQFPFPDAELRGQIWKSAFPTRSQTKGLDPSKLALLQITGGSIRNIAINAAFKAASTHGPITMRLLAESARRELAKSDKPIPDVGLRSWR